MLCALSALRGTSSGATMSIPGRAGTTHPPVLGTPASLIGSESPHPPVRGSDLLSQIETFVTLCGMVGLRAKVLGQMGWTTSPYQRACALSCPSLAIYGPGSLQRGTLTPARTSLLKPAAGQKVQPPIDHQGAYHRQRCEYPEEHSEHALPSLACCRVQQRIVTHGRRPCNNVVAILAKDKTPSLQRSWV